MVPSCGQGYVCLVHCGLQGLTLQGDTAGSFYLQQATEEELMMVKNLQTLPHKYCQAADYDVSEW